MLVLGLVAGIASALIARWLDITSPLGKLAGVAIGVVIVLDVYFRWTRRRARMPGDQPVGEDLPTTDPEEAASAIRSLAGDLTHRWLQTGEIPDDAVEGTVPTLREFLGGGMELSFDDFQHKHYVRPDWGFAQFATPEAPAPFEMYLPTSWRIEPTGEPGVAIVVDETGSRRQVLQLAGRAQYGDAVDAALYGGDLLGFEVGRDYGQFIHWRFVAARPDGYDVWSIFSAGDQALVSLGEAADVEGLKVQLTASANSIPWHHWIAFAKNSDA